MDMYKKALKIKLRFNTRMGNISAEDLWDLPLSSTNHDSLDELAIYYDAKLKHETTSFVKEVKSANTELQLQFDIVKDIIDTKLAERAVAAERKDKREKKQKLLEALDRANDAELNSASKEEIMKMIEALDE